MTLDREVNGPASVQNVARARAADAGKEGLMSNGQVSRHC
jgi:hypothetical protein